MTDAPSWKTLPPALALAAVLLACQGPAFAHGGGKPEHGGGMQMIGDTSIELVNGADGVTLFVEEEGEEIASTGMTAKLTILDKGAESQVTMDAASGNAFAAKGLKIAPGASVAVMLTAKDSGAQTGATFTIK